MKKDIKKRLEKALIALQEPRGSTLESIIKAVNKDSPILSLRKLLKVLEEGINEGFLCMYNGRFKLRQQLPAEKTVKEDGLEDTEENMVKDRNKKKKTPESDYVEEDTEIESDEEDQVSVRFESKTDVMKKGAGKQSYEEPEKNTQSSESLTSKSVKSKKKRTRFSKQRNQKIRPKGRHKKSQKPSKEVEDVEDYSVLKLTSKNITENKTSRSLEKVNMKKQRGPRCTSMKKDVRMPSKVHIPFLPSLVPQKTNNFNDLLRRSPEPLNGPPFDNFILNTENLGLFDIAYEFM